MSKTIVAILSPKVRVTSDGTQWIVQATGAPSFCLTRDGVVRCLVEAVPAEGEKTAKPASTMGTDERARTYRRFEALPLDPDAKRRILALPEHIKDVKP